MLAVSSTRVAQRVYQTPTCTRPHWSVNATIAYVILPEHYSDVCIGVQHSTLGNSNNMLLLFPSCTCPRFEDWYMHTKKTIQVWLSIKAIHNCALHMVPITHKIGTVDTGNYFQN